MSNREDTKQKNPNVPTLRFPYYSNNWIKTTLGKECHALKYGIGASAIPFDGLHRYLRITDINDLLAEYVSPSFLDEKALLQPGDILLARTGATVGETFLFEDDGTQTYYAGFLIRARTLKTNPRFLYYQLKTNSFWKWVRVMSARSGQPGINAEEYASFPIFTSSHSEMEKVSSFLALVDKRICVQNKIIEKLESLKNGIQERIYLLGKNKEPLRRILCEVSEKSTVQNQYPVLSSTVKGLFLQSEYFERSVASNDNVGYKVVRKGQIIISPQNLWMGNLTFNEKYESGIVSPSYKIYDICPEYSKKYVHWLLTSQRSFFNYKLVSEQGASIVRRNLNTDAFMELSLPIVKDKVIVSKIEKLIGSLEMLLDVEKKRVNLLLKQKQFLLSNLFI